MKTIVKLMLLLFISLISMSAFSQIKVNDIGTRTEIGHFRHLMSIGMYVKDTDTTYVLSYRDMQYQTIDVTHTIAFKGTLDDLYNAMVDVLDKKNETGISVTLGKTNVTIMERWNKVYFTDHDGAYFGASKSMLDNLFGKIQP